MFVVVKRLLYLSLVGVSTVIGLLSWSRSSQAMEVLAISPISHTVIIDAGHGGEDGGAVSITGIAESQINLAIACKLEAVLALYGIAPQMLRREDISLHDSTAATLREKKVSDLHNRVSMVQAAEDPLLISIHQNTYPEKRYHGAQVFYAPTSGSKELAQQVQQSLREYLDPGNMREIKQIPDTVYLMNHIHCPAVLVECGFLTNPEEEILLRQDSYQQKLAASLASAILTAPENTNKMQEHST